MNVMRQVQQAFSGVQVAGSLFLVSKCSQQLSNASQLCDVSNEA
jgi:hypothetical protein